MEKKFENGNQAESNLPIEGKLHNLDNSIPGSTSDLRNTLPIKKLIGMSNGVNEEEPKNESRVLRGLKKLGRGIVFGTALVAGAGVQNKDAEAQFNVEVETRPDSSNLNLKTADDLVVYFEKHKLDPSFVIYAASRLIDEMSKDGLQSVNTLENNSESVSKEIDVLRNFIRIHIQSSEMGKYYTTVTKEIISSHKFEVINLLKIIEDAKKANKVLNDKFFKQKSHKDSPLQGRNNPNIM